MMIGPEQGKKASGKPGKKKGKAKKAKRREAELGAATAFAGDRTPLTPTPAAGSTAVPAAEPPLHHGNAAATRASDAVPPAVGPDLLAWIDRVQARVDHLLTLVDPALAPPGTGAATAAADGHDPAPDATAEPESRAAAPETVPTAPQPAASRPGQPATAAIRTQTQSETTEPETTEATRADARASSLAEAWARRQQQASASRGDAAPVEDAVRREDEAPEPDDPAGLEDDAAGPDDATGLEDATGPQDETAVEDAAPVDDATPHGDAPPFEDDEPFEPADARLTAVLVARELIARGQSAADVRRRLREGYGVVDPDAVLAQVAA